MTETFSRVLGLPSAYRLFSRLVGGNVWRVYLDEYVKPTHSERILDIGCGPADILSYLPDADYTGVDISREYVEAAKKRFKGKGRFLCHDVGLFTLEQERGTFDLVLATGVLHHLDDERALKLFELAHLALSPNGRLITYDGCYVDGQSPIARWLLRNDRGKYIRVPQQYEQLAARKFSKIDLNLRQDLLRVPYSHLIMRCSNVPRESKP
jgi:SAM-dependent methyltransferase